MGRSTGHDAGMRERWKRAVLQGLRHHCRIKCWEKLYGAEVGVQLVGVDQRLCLISFISLTVQTNVGLNNDRQFIHYLYLAWVVDGSPVSGGA